MFKIIAAAALVFAAPVASSAQSGSNIASTRPSSNSTVIMNPAYGPPAPAPFPSAATQAPQRLEPVETAQVPARSETGRHRRRRGGYIEADGGLIASR